MTFNEEMLLQRLADLEDGYSVARYIVAFSGGLDSTVLLHALCRTRERHASPLVALHVNHDLHPDSSSWEQHCRRVAQKLEVEYLGRTVAVRKRAAGLEAAAREARYEALGAEMQENDVVLSAHHEEDQAETLLLNLMRGSGLAGLAGIGARQPFGPGLLIRPLLDVSRQAIERYARELGLEWIEDPANVDLRFDRNYLRREILPRLRTHWPAVSSRLRRSAELAAESAALQDDLAKLDLGPLVAASGAADRLDIPGLRRLPAARQRNVLRYAIKNCGLPPAPSSRLAQVLAELLPARSDAQPLVRWHGGEVRRYRQKLYLLPETEALSHKPVLPQRMLSTGGPLDLGRFGRLPLGTLQLEGGDSVGIDPVLANCGLEVRFRRGGEKIRPFGRDATRPLKKLLQEAGVVPWMRQWVPLLFAGEALVAVGDLWIAADCARDAGFVVRWDQKPSIF